MIRLLHLLKTNSTIHPPVTDHIKSSQILKCRFIFIRQPILDSLNLCRPLNTHRHLFVVQLVRARYLFDHYIYSKNHLRLSSILRLLIE